MISTIQTIKALRFTLQNYKDKKRKSLQTTIIWCLQGKREKIGIESGKSAGIILVKQAQFFPVLYFFIKV